MKNITVISSVSWEKYIAEEIIETSGYNVRYVSNKSVPNADLVCDTGLPFHNLSKVLPPEKRIYIPTEPGPILKMNQVLANQIAGYYKCMILSWHKELRMFPQTVYFPASFCWVDGGWKPKDKAFGISGFISGKNDPGLPGYPVRRKLLSVENQIKIPSMVWNFRGNWQGKPHGYPVVSKNSGMRYMYHFAIENCREEGFFTEKVMDCFRTFSIPLYWGDPSIVSEFNVQGIILLDPNNIVGQVNALTPEDYKRRLPAAKDNYNRAGKLLRTKEKILSTIFKHLGK